MTVYSLTPSPLGDLVLAGDGQQLSVLLPADRLEIDPAWTRGDRAYAQAREQLDRYFAGKPVRFDVNIDPQGSAFDQSVWQALRQIPSGETVTYGEIAARIGKPKATRAVGGAIGRNPLLIVTPCHRVVAAGGALGGFSAGVERKRQLLALEAA